MNTSKIVIQKSPENTPEFLAVLVQSPWFFRIIYLMILFMGAGYLWLLNSLATIGFGLENLKVERLELQKELQVLETQISLPESFYALESYETTQKLTAVSSQSEKFVEVKSENLAYDKSSSSL